MPRIEPISPIKVLKMLDSTSLGMYYSVTREKSIKIDFTSFSLIIIFSHIKKGFLLK